jgi:hypothetical protein
MKKILSAILTFLSLQSFSIEVSHQELQQIQQDLYNAQVKIQYLLSKPVEAEIFTGIAAYTNATQIMKDICKEGYEEHGFLITPIKNAKKKALESCAQEYSSCKIFDVRYELHPVTSPVLIECRVTAFAKP